jgi:hypothetical protein
MSAPNYTPGPWNVTGDLATISGTRPGDPYTFTVAETCGYKEEREANARLIAAAPELLEAIIELSHWAEMQPGMPQGTFEIVRAAIAKAKGGAQ